jgi:hypothetical protein
MDPESQTFCILFTTQPLGEDLRAPVRLSNAVAAALE